MNCIFIVLRYYNNDWYVADTIKGKGYNITYFGADLIGADLRDADVSGVNLSNSIFLTKAQINTAKGDSHTKLPVMLVRPTYWLK